MKIDGQLRTSIWYDRNKSCVSILDQTQLPFSIKYIDLTEVDHFITAIRTMQVRGAPLIGVTGAFGLAFALKENPSDMYIEEISFRIANARPTAVNLQWAVDEVLNAIKYVDTDSRFDIALRTAKKIRQDDIENCSLIGDYGLKIIQNLYDSISNKRTINILTHCNAGWLATIDWGTAIAPIYKAQEAGIPIHVWVDETRPRNQGTSLTAFELGQQGIAHTIIPDNTGGHLMQHGMVDLCIVGSDRTTTQGDVCNKIGTYLKALAAFDNNVPFYAALPCSTFDWSITDGIKEIPIEQRDAIEVTHMTGVNSDNIINTIRISPESSPVANYGFDVTPAKYITGIITEKGIFKANKDSLYQLKQQLGLS
ncbi:MAG: S-methyl-5-thioribose-1-phosphate isomerase [Gammaproteobacteria bacterium]|nr:MAG: S-methyl-5-thioribose-1-phosphate isomerase [Gammaproteobacteria bacterium]